MVDAADVKIWGEFVGSVKWDNVQKVASFQYDKKFLEKGYDLSPLKMPIKNGEQIFTFYDLRASKDNAVDTFKGLPGLLSDALPDKYGNLLINIWLNQNNRLANSMNPVEQLCFIGSRGMGALEFEPSQISKSKNTFSIEISSLVNAAQKILSKRESLEVNIQDDEKKSMTEILKIGTSAGGARPKAVITYNTKTGEIRSGQTKAPKGFEHWLLKLDGVSDAQFGVSHGFGRIEYAYYEMAKDCGIEMMECKLLEENNRAHFMTKRFDRDKNNIKHHVQTFCGIQHFDYNHIYGYSYEQLFQTMRMLKLTYPEAEEMFRRMVFNVMATNYDDHTKNFSFRLKKGGKWELSPAYDICYSYAPENEWVNQHTLSINSKHRNITIEDLMTIAKANNIKKGKKIIEDIKMIVCNWNTYAKKSDVNKKLTGLISGNLACNNIK